MPSTELEKRKRKNPDALPLSGYFLALTGLGTAASTGFVNVSAWWNQGSAQTEKLINATISGSLELAGVAGLAFAAWQLSRRRYLRSAAAAAFAGGAIYMNTNASTAYYTALADAKRNQIEASGAGVGVARASIARYESEIASLIEQNGGVVPRPKPVIEAAYSAFDPAANPLNMARKNAEIGMRAEYERLQAMIEALRSQQAGDAVASNDEAIVIISDAQMPFFIWGMELFKGGVFFALGTKDLTPKKRTPRTPHGDPPRGGSRRDEDEEGGDDPAVARLAEHRARRQRYAMIRRKGWTPRP